MPRHYMEGDEPVEGLRLVAFLGEGGFGTVWKAVRPGETEVAVKIIRLDRTQGRKEFRALQRVKRIRNPNLVPIHAFWVKDEAGNLIDSATAAGETPRMGDTPTTEFGRGANLLGPSADDLPPISEAQTAEFAQTATPAARPGGPAADELIIEMGLCERTLFDRLQQCRSQGMEGIPIDELLPYMQDAARAIDYLGSSGAALQHCDIKPQNIMIVGGAVQVCDFGLAQFVGVARTSVSKAGTVAYAAPECMRDGEPSGSTDQYSLAISYYELRTGDLPYRCDTVPAVTAAVLSGDLDFSQVSPAEQEVLRRATSLDPGKRYATASEMVAALREAFREAPPPPTLPARRKKWPWTVAALAGVAAVAALAAFAFKLLPVENLPKTPVAQTDPVKATSPTVSPNPQTEPNEANHKEAGAHFQQGVRLAERQDFEEAVREFRSAVGLDPNYESRVEFSDALGELARQKINTGRCDEAKALLREAVQLDADNAVLFGRLGAVHFLLGEFAEAEEAFTEALRLDSSDAERSLDLVNRGRARQEIGQYAEAIGDFREAAKLDPGNGDAPYLLAECHRMQAEQAGAAADYQQAVAAYTEAIDAPQRENQVYDLSLAHFWRGVCQLGLNRWSEAERDFHAAFEQPAGRSQIHAEAEEIAAAFCRAGRFGEAAEWAGRVIAKDPQNSFAHYLLAECHYGQQEFEKAAADYSQAIDFYSTERGAARYEVVAAYQGRGRCYLSLGRLDESRADFKKVLELGGAVQGLAENLARLAAALADAQKLSEAVTWLNRAVELAPDDATRMAYRSQLKQYESRLD